MGIYKEITTQSLADIFLVVIGKQVSKNAAWKVVCIWWNNGQTCMLGNKSKWMFSIVYSSVFKRQKEDNKKKY